MDDMLVDILLFPDFETLDALGPAEVLGRARGVSLQFLSLDGGVVHSSQGVPVHTMSADHSGPADVLLVPGGQGTRSLVRDNAFLDEVHRLARQSTWCLGVCTGAALLACAGLLCGKEATTNKRAFDWVVSLGRDVHWVRRARWVVDGAFYTSSGISAGIDMSLGFIADRQGRSAAYEIATAMEYLWNENAEEDPFCK